jgi:excisionase family DNA binding protein
MEFRDVEGSISNGALPSKPKFRISDRLVLPWDEKKTISAARAADMLNCGRMTVLRLIERGDVLAYQLRPGVAGSPWRINYDSVLKYLAKIHDEAGLEPRFSV